MLSQLPPPSIHILYSFCDIQKLYSPCPNGKPQYKVKLRWTGNTPPLAIKSGWWSGILHHSKCADLMCYEMSWNQLRKIYEFQIILTCPKWNQKHTKDMYTKVHVLFSAILIVCADEPHQIMWRSNKLYSEIYNGDQFSKYLSIFRYPECFDSTKTF